NYWQETPRPPRQTIPHSRNGVYQASVERKEEEVFESGRQVPSKQLFVVHAIADDHAFVPEPVRDNCQRGDELVLDPVAVVPEVRRGFENGGIYFPLFLVDVGRKPVGDSRPPWRTAVVSKIDTLVGADVVGKGVLVHVHYHVHTERACPLHDLRDSIEERVVETAAFGL